MHLQKEVPVTGPAEPFKEFQWCLVATKKTDFLLEYIIFRAELTSSSVHTMKRPHNHKEKSRREKTKEK